jgi:hypothetical protein
MTCERPLLDAIPLGALLSRLLQLALPADDRDAFLGDLIEEAHLRRPFSSEAQLARWVWAQALRSLPPLVGLRARRLGATGLAVLARLCGPHPSGRPLVLIGSRGGHRGWPLPLAVSLSAHSLVVAVVLGWLFAGVEEVQPPRLDTLAAAIIPTSAAEAEAPPATPRAPAIATSLPAPVRRYRPARKPLLTAMAPAPLAGPLPGPVLPGLAPASSPPPASMSVSADGPVRIGAPGVRLPPRVAEKRCLSCPPPQLPPHYARLARGRDMLVRTCVGASGQVDTVDVLRGFDSVISREVTETVRHWRLSPYRLNGHPVPFCYVTRFLFAGP